MSGAEFQLLFFPGVEIESALCEPFGREPLGRGVQLDLHNFHLSIVRYVTQFDSLLTAPLPPHEVSQFPVLLLDCSLSDQCNYYLVGLEFESLSAPGKD